MNFIVKITKKNCQVQENSIFFLFLLRFGAGIVIYWFGFLDQILDYKDNGNNIHILDNFPNKSDLVLLCSDETNSEPVIEKVFS